MSLFLLQPKYLMTNDALGSLIRHQSEVDMRKVRPLQRIHARKTLTVTASNSDGLEEAAARNTHLERESEGTK